MALFDSTFAQSFLSSLSSLSNSVLLAAIVLLVGVILSRMAGKLILRMLSDLDVNQMVKKAFGADVPIDEMTSLVSSWALYAISVLISFNVLGIDVLVVQLLGGVLFFVLLVSMIIALQHAVPNLYAGFALRRQKMVLRGDQLKLRSLTGTVAHTGLMQVTLVTKEKETVYIPNRALFAEKHFAVRR